MSWDPGVYPLHIERLQRGETVQFRPKGNSMSPKIESGQLVTVAPVKPEDVEQGDIVLCKVKGKIYVHQVVSLRNGLHEEFLIGNNRGYTNGWTSAKNIYGKVIKVEK